MRAIISALLALSTPSLAATQEPDRPSLFSEGAITSEIAAARDWLTLTLVDYDSARFRDVRVVLISPDRRNRRDVALAVCGLVNARNRMGGYTGYTHFYFSSALPLDRRGDLGVFAPDLCTRARPVTSADYTDQVAPGTSR